MTPADLAESMVPVACELACAVHDQDPAAVAEILDRYTHEKDREARALLVVLAAMMPVEDSSPAELLAWAGDGETARPSLAADTFTGRRMAEYARHRNDGMCIRRAGALVWVSRRTAERYEQALIRSGRAPWRACDPGAPEAASDAA